MVAESTPLNILIESWNDIHMQDLAARERPEVISEHYWKHVNELVDIWWRYNREG